MVSLIRHGQLKHPAKSLNPHTKMKTSIHILGILALASSISLAEGDRKQDRKRPNPAEIMKKLDANNDGSISKTEFMAGERAQKNPERAAKAFAHMDSDGDGQLSPNDFAQRRNNGGGKGGKRPNPAKIFKHLDKDDNGSISKREFLSGERAQKNPEMAAKLFGRLDADNNGEITPDEFAKRPRPGDRRKGGKGDDLRPGKREGGNAGPNIE